ncbi:MAG: hypothetical protein FWH48_02555, partial [Oscillospiraceae bacterium]|nr:hypothetical protein [Oscillospiraceae bacterium]
MGNRFIAIMLIVFAAIGVLGFAGCENDAETKETEENNTMESATESIEITAEKEQAAYVPEQGVLWTQLIRGGSGMTFLEFDIDGDGINELIGANGQVYDAGGNVTWSPSAGGTLLAIRDIDNDGKNELLMQLYGSAPTIGIVSYETGQVLWQIEYAPAASVTNVQFIILDDITGDGICELFPWFGGLEVMHCYAFDKGIENGYELWSKDFSDDVLAYVGAFAATAAAVDYDGDGVKEIMLSCHNQLVYLNGRNGSVIAGDQNNVVNN